jgi:hypothetical protein
LRSKNILILGGYGGAGTAISRLMLSETDVNVIIAGRHKSEADELADKLNIEFPGRVSGVFADASDSKTLSAAFQNVQMVIVASSTADYAETVARTAIEKGIDYLDIHYSQTNIPALKRLATEIVAADRCFITQAGFCPGLPSALVRLASGYFSSYEKAKVGMAMNTRFEKSDALDEFMDSLSDLGAHVFQEGRWKDSGAGDVASIDFGYNFHKKVCYPMDLEEMWALPEMLGLEELSLNAAGFNWFVDYLVIPMAFILGKIRRGLGRSALTNLMIWGIDRFSPSETDVVLVLEAQGRCKTDHTKVRIVVECNDPYYITAAPVVACVRQYLDGRIKPGLNILGHAVEAKLLFEDLQRMGITVNISLT